MSNPNKADERDTVWKKFLHEHAETLILDYTMKMHKKKIKCDFITYLKEQFNDYLYEY